MSLPSANLFGAICISWAKSIIIFQNLNCRLLCWHMLFQNLIRTRMKYFFSKLYFLIKETVNPTFWLNEGKINFVYSCCIISILLLTEISYIICNFFAILKIMKFIFDCYKSFCFWKYSSWLWFLVPLRPNLNHLNIPLNDCIIYTYI